MPYTEPQRDRKGSEYWQEPVTLLSLASRAKEFPKRGGCIAWKVNPGTEFKKIKAFMNQSLVSAGISNYLTRDLDGLSMKEIGKSIFSCIRALN